MIVKNAEKMAELGEVIVSYIEESPAVIELVGDVGAGKTTLTSGIARGFGVSEEVSSPSFVLNRKYASRHGGILSHYDFYRLEDSGILGDEFYESVNDPNTLTIVEWASSVAGVLPEERTILRISYDDNDENARRVELVAGNDHLRRLFGADAADSEDGK